MQKITEIISFLIFRTQNYANKLIARKSSQ